jgi:hypothetical protein
MAVGRAPPRGRGRCEAELPFQLQTGVIGADRLLQHACSSREVDG